MVERAAFKPKPIPEPLANYLYDYGHISLYSEYDPAEPLAYKVKRRFGVISSGLLTPSYGLSRQLKQTSDSVLHFIYDIQQIYACAVTVKPVSGATMAVRQLMKDDGFEVMICTKERLIAYRPRV